MKLYLVTSGSEKEKARLLSAGVRNILMSYPHWKDISFMPQGAQIMIDSGAYTAWQQGLNINKGEYAIFLSKIISEHNGYYIFSIINLDIIPGVPGRYPFYAETKAASEDSWMNWKYLSKYVSGVIPVFHQHEEISWLEKMVSEADYIGISPDNSDTIKHRMKWLEIIFNQLYYWGCFKKQIPLRTHAFGFTFYRGLVTYPFYSADSTTWSRQKMDITMLLRIERDLTNIWKARGIYWEEDCELCIKSHSI